jgi:hypothetical protein
VPFVVLDDADLTERVCSVAGTALGFCFTRALATELHVVNVSSSAPTGGEPSANSTHRVAATEFAYKQTTTFGGR